MSLIEFVTSRDNVHWHRGHKITAGLAAASRRWRDRRLAVAELRRRGVERGALRRRNTTDTHSRLKPLLYVLLTLSYKLALIAITSALCTLHSARTPPISAHKPSSPAARRTKVRLRIDRGRDRAARSAATNHVTMTRSLLPLNRLPRVTRSKVRLSKLPRVNGRYP